MINNLRNQPNKKGKLGGKFQRGSIENYDITNL